MKSSQKISYEPKDDVLNIWLSREPIDYAEQNGDVIVHFSKDNEAVYIEILDASKMLKDLSKTIPSNLKKSWFSIPTSSIAHRIK
ncbi:DUF2283 domain-containing protein [Candidatus Daviesbacteria bacterium]|nr:DUF2283 domain-containing protein [Candidatus Daviesbacteria bacterium]